MFPRQKERKFFATKCNRMVGKRFICRFPRPGERFLAVGQSCFNLMATFAVSGVCDGASRNFVIYLGLLIAIQRVLEVRRNHQNSWLEQGGSDFWGGLFWLAPIP